MIADSNFNPKRRLIGVYDENIICCDCEKLFNDSDNYAAKLFIDNFDDSFIKHKINNLEIMECKKYNYNLLMKFFISILWRAHLTDIFFFQHVNIGDRYLTLIKEIFINGKISYINNFTVSIEAFDREGLFFPPQRFRNEGVNYYIFYLGVLNFMIKVDSQPDSVHFLPFIIGEKNSLIIRIQPFIGTPESYIKKEIQKNTKNNNLRFN